jgi:Nucleotide modification associated domain 1
MFCIRLNALRARCRAGLCRTDEASTPQNSRKNLENQTQLEYDRVLARCRTLFLAKTHDYGTAWRILRLPSVTDQIYIKAQRIRSIQEKGTQLVADGVEEEFVAIINYCLIALMQLRLPADAPLDLDPAAVARAYDEETEANRQLLFAKNHDYGEAWRQMRIESITDIILMKLHRTKQIEDLGGLTRVSEGVEANYRDMLNYAVFVLIKMSPGDLGS